MTLTAAELKTWEKELAEDAVASDIAGMLDVLKRLACLVFESVHESRGGGYRERCFEALAAFEKEVRRCTGKEPGGLT